MEMRLDKFMLIEMQESGELRCQSCGLALYHNDDLGLNADGSRNYDYCRRCYEGGSFTQPYITVNEMIENVAHYISALKAIPVDQALTLISDEICQLKRWKSHNA
jgi:hypothetical protein